MTLIVDAATQTTGMSNASTVDVDGDLWLLWSEDVAPPCDCKKHRDWGSEGPAEWVVLLDAGTCTCQAPICLWCTHCLEAFQDWIQTFKVFECRHCGARDVYPKILSVEPLNKKAA